MATKKSASTTNKKSTQKKPTAKKTTVTTASPTRPLKKEPVETTTSASANLPGIIIAEVVGTFALTMVALLAFQNDIAPLYIGLTLMVLVVAIGSISGSHVNPAVTFGLWAARKLKASLLPVYWIAQFVGAILAVLLLNNISNGGYVFDLSGINSLNWNIVTVELVGTAVFLFGVVAIVSQKTLGTAAKALGIGVSLTVGLLVSTSLFTALQRSIDTSELDIANPETIPREFLIKGATLNPAIALATTENTPDQLMGTNSTNADGEAAPLSRLSLEVIIGTLIGAALGGNLYLLAASAQRRQN